MRAHPQRRRRRRRARQAAARSAGMPTAVAAIRPAQAAQPPTAVWQHPPTSVSSPLGRPKQILSSRPSPSLLCAPARHGRGELRAGTTHTAHRGAQSLCGPRGQASRERHGTEVTLTLGAIICGGGGCVAVDVALSMAAAARARSTRGSGRTRGPQRADLRRQTTTTRPS